VEKTGRIVSDCSAPSSGDATIATTRASYDDRVMATPISDDTTHLNSRLKS